MLSKTSRQIALLHIFLYSKVIEIKEITGLIKAGKKTISRDLHDLQDAGLLNVVFSIKEKGYIHIDDNNRCPFSAPVFTNNNARNMHLDKLIRLASIMINLRNHAELPFYEEGCRCQETCSSWYKKKFPGLSKRTMERDFAELGKIGYEISYDYWDKCYIVCFPEGLEGIEDRLRQLHDKRED